MTQAKRIDGKAMAAELSTKIVTETETLLSKHGLKPGLAVVIVGDDQPARFMCATKNVQPNPVDFIQFSTHWPKAHRRMTY